MSPTDAINLIQTGGAVVCLILALWLVGTRRVVTRGEFDRLADDYKELKTKADAANDELVKQSSTNARLVEGLLMQRQEAENIRRTAQRRGEESDAR